MTWLIRNTVDRALFWSSTQGWVDITSKDLAAFDDRAKAASRLPNDGEWVDKDHLAQRPSTRPGFDLKIEASANSDDRWAEAHFDAAPWFHQASDQEILALAQCEWGGDYPADYVAEYMAGHHAELKRMFDYISVAGTRRDPVGFECWIDADNARTWLNRHRPHLLPIITRMDEEAEHFEDALFPVLAAAGITSVLIRFDGSGDSGQIEEIDAVAGETPVSLPAGQVTIQRAYWGATEPESVEKSIEDAVETLAYAFLEETHGGWENNEGAYGEFTFNVAARTITLDYNERYEDVHYTQHSF